MGCVQSRKECPDTHPNIFRVINIDEHHNPLWPGQIELTNQDLLLYREGRDTMVWPLRTLRKYGYQDDVFSFECGRRSATGEGIYAFKCQRADTLFTTLRDNIQMRNVIHECVPFRMQFMNGSPTRFTGTSSNGVMVQNQSIDSEPLHNLIPAFRTTNDNGAINNRRPPELEQAPLSPSSVEVLEVTPLNPPTTSSSQVTNIYQVEDLKSRDPVVHHQEPHPVQNASYCNDFNKDLEKLRGTLKNGNQVIVPEKLSHNQYINAIRLDNDHPPLSPTLSTSSEHYARLSLDDGSNRPYMNLSAVEVNKLNKLHPTKEQDKDLNKNDILVKPLQNVNYTNVRSRVEELKSYANLGVGEVLEQIDFDKTATFQNFAEPELPKKPCRKPEDSDIYGSTEELLNYAILDVEEAKRLAALKLPIEVSLSSPQTSTSSQTHSIKGTSTSMEKTILEAPECTNGLGYTTIDFDKTIALTSVATNKEPEEEKEPEGSRKTRHNSTTPACSSPTLSTVSSITEKFKFG